MPDPPTAPSLTVRGGPLDGKSILLDQAVDEILIGSDAECGLCLDSPGISPVHARIWVDANGVRVHDTRSPAGLYVNDARVDDEAPLVEGDVLWLGPPNAEGSVAIRYGHSTGEAELVATEPAMVPEPPMAPEPSAEIVTLESPEVIEAAPAEELALDAPEPAAESVLAPEPELLIAPVPSPEAVSVAPPAVAKVAPVPPMAERPTPPAPPAPAKPPSPATVKAPTPAQPSRSRPTAREVRYAAVALVLLVVAVGAYLYVPSLLPPHLDSVAPTRVRVGQVVTLTGSHFRETPGGTQVLFGGDKPGRVVEVSPTRLGVEVPEIPATPGRDLKVPVWVRAGKETSNRLSVALYEPPHLRGISPDVAMPGEEVRLSGSGWATGAVVRFGAAEADVVEVTAEAIAVRVPALEGAPGTEISVKVSMGADSSNTLPFVLGHLPMVTGIEPRSATPGDVVAVKGRGFRPSVAGNVVRVGGAAALVLAATEKELKVVVPGVTAAEEVPIEVRCEGAEPVGKGTIGIKALPEPSAFRFVAEPRPGSPEQAVVATGVGPAFILAAAGKSAAERALEAQKRLNEAAAAALGPRGFDLEVRGSEEAPIIGIKGGPDALLEPTNEDAAAYGEEAAKSGRKDPPVTTARLARWWSAVAQDLFLLSRGDAPRYAAALAPEGRVPLDVWNAIGKKPLSPEAVAGLKPALREALRTWALRVPASLK